MDFGHALAILKAGGRVTRAGWPASDWLEVRILPDGAHVLWTRCEDAARAWAPFHDDLLAEDWLPRGGDAGSSCPCRCAPPPGCPGQEREQPTAGEEKVVRVTAGMSDADIDLLAEKLGRRLANSLQPAGYRTSR